MPLNDEQELIPFDRCFNSGVQLSELFYKIYHLLDNHVVSILTRDWHHYCRLQSRGDT